MPPAVNRPTVKLKLELDQFEESSYLPVLNDCLIAGISFNSIDTLGDTPDNRRKLYDLNKACSQDIPARGEFFSFDEFSQRRFGRRYDPRGVFIATDANHWIGMAATSNWSHKGFAFNEMTGVLHEYRRRGIALALKLFGIRYARSLGVATIYTIHNYENSGAIKMNRRLGFVDAEWESLT